MNFSGFLLVSMGSILGGLSRWGVASVSSRWPEFAWGTLIVNTLGCGLAGYFSARMGGDWVRSHPVFLFVSVGFLGSFTTFSAFGFETLKYFQNSDWNRGLLNIGLNLLLGFASLVLGQWLGSRG